MHSIFFNTNVNIRKINIGDEYNNVIISNIKNVKNNNLLENEQHTINSIGIKMKKIKKEENLDDKNIIKTIDNIRDQFCENLSYYSYLINIKQKFIDQYNNLPSFNNMDNYNNIELFKKINLINNTIESLNLVLKHLFTINYEDLLLIQIQSIQNKKNEIVQLISLISQFQFTFNNLKNSISFDKFNLKSIFIERIEIILKLLAIEKNIFNIILLNIKNVQKIFTTDINNIFNIQNNNIPIEGQKKIYYEEFDVYENEKMFIYESFKICLFPKLNRISEKNFNNNNNHILNNLIYSIFRTQDLSSIKNLQGQLLDESGKYFRSTDKLIKKEQTEQHLLYFDNSFKKIYMCLYINRGFVLGNKNSLDLIRNNIIYDNSEFDSFKINFLEIDENTNFTIKTNITQSIKKIEENEINFNIVICKPKMIHQILVLEDVQRKNINLPIFVQQNLNLKNSLTPYFGFKLYKKNKFENNSNNEQNILENKEENLNKNEIKSNLNNEDNILNDYSDNEDLLFYNQNSDQQKINYNYTQNSQIIITPNKFFL